MTPDDLDDLDARIDEACGDDPVAAGTARRRLGWLAARPPGPYRPRAWDPRLWTPRRQRLAPDRALLDAMTARGLLHRARRGHEFADRAVRDRLAVLWRRGPGALTMLPARTRLDAGRAAGQGPRPTHGNKVEFLVDNEAAWGRLADEVAGARSSVRGLLFMLDVPHVRMAFARDPARDGGPTGGVRLEERLLAAADRGVAVHLVLNHVTPSLSPANTTHPVERFFRTRDPGRRVRLRRLRTPQTLPVHGKVYVIDDRVAYLVGSVFAQEYFDGREHLIDDPRRGHLRWRSSVRAPVHDVSVRIEGPAVADLDRTVRLHWDHCRPVPGDEMPPFRPPAAAGAPGAVTLQVTRTLHGAGRYAGLPAGETGIHESYLRALATARRFVYLENQYLTCTELVDALVDALKRTPGLQLIALINIRPDVPHYAGWQRGAVERLLTGLGDDRDRAGVFTLWSHEKGPGRTRILRDHVHSKVAIIDDEWLTVGSANLDGVSLTCGEHELHRPPLIRLARLFGGASGGDPWQARATEVNVAHVGEEAGRLRRELWAEHLGYPGPDDPALAEPPGVGWLELWRRRAELKLAGLRGPDPMVRDPRILPYPHTGGVPEPGCHKPAAYLRALGVDPGRLEVHARFRSFSFRTGRWR
jgi:phosphatidylserine/phosphatidylglycerophosphate/cardiolipin synthase-like enzyme